jgi:serine protease DegQ
MGLRTDWLMRHTAIAAAIAALMALPAMPSSLADEQQRLRLSFSEAVRKAMPSVVGIQVKGEEHVEESNAFFNHPVTFKQGAQSSKGKTRTVGSIGSGVIVASTDNAGLIVTNFHVIEGAVRIGIKLNDGRAFEAKLIGRDAPTDIALLSVEAPRLVPIRLGTRSPLQVGDLVLAIGAPFGLESTSTLGMISSLFRSSVHYRNFEGYIQHDASVNPGNSGGALLNMDGELIGINTAITSPSGGNVGLAFAQPVGLAIKIGDQIIKHGRVIRGDIGVMCSDVTPKIAADNNLDVSQGAVLTRVASGSPAEKAGLNVGDAVVEVGVHKPERLLAKMDPISMVPIVSGRNLEAVLGIHGVGDKLIVKYRRGSAAGTAEVEFGPLPEPERHEAPEAVGRLRGLVVTELGQQNAKFGEVRGVLVVEAKSRSAAEFAGFLPKDIFTHIRSRSIRTPDDLFELGAGGPDAPEVRLIRGDTPLRFKLPF